MRVSKLPGFALCLLPGLALAGAAVLLAVGCASRSGTMQVRSFPAPAMLPAQASLPDPLVMFNGKRVESKREWESRRRPELKALFAHYMYGSIPAKPASMMTTKVGEYPDF